MAAVANAVVAMDGVALTVLAVVLAVILDVETAVLTVVVTGALREVLVEVLVAVVVAVVVMAAISVDAVEEKFVKGRLSSTRDGSFVTVTSSSLFLFNEFAPVISGGVEVSVNFLLLRDFVGCALEGLTT